ncbi:iron-sulfur cluster carrier protein ApbC [Azospirillum sp. RWY-5-1]|uniref:Iron-sulfur cluster carrier protein n=1 Tax=Azospirillum oleiclasticum TaxID=2735135 RepID=A0ABX2TER2_9PROT|nr:iron-sulfur cluster carrier protein ApbC [Azospirillum oleiclasticum]NYZ17707.1 iron-sulfur cluster carrier protein ApbC [Azospirillum oleiclasticum]NYZ21185.1 iron-sulfur cluster carrier protein ApbC [Azospirillum oleiclasticum]
MAQVTEAQVLAALGTVQDPDRGADIVTLRMISGLAIKDGNVAFAIEVDPRRGPQAEPLRHAAEKVVDRIPGVTSVTAVLTAHRVASSGGGHGHAHGPAPGHNHNHGGGQGHGHAHPAQQPEKPLVPGVRAIVAVASGKGGVGKSTTATNLALGLAANGLRVGLLDADIYGPSMPRMMGISGRPTSRDGKVLEPMENYGVKVMSMGFLVAEDTPMIWRGPMVMSALQQMLRDVNWGELDVLVVDMPPGTGDAQLTMAQQVPLAGAVIVSTPQDIALLDARKGLNMFRKVDVPVLGIIENMSYFCCPNCGHRTDVFSHGGAKREAERLGAEFLGEIPLDIVIRETSDAGTPVVVATPESEHAKVYRRIAARVWEKVSGGASGRAAPRIVVQ